MQHNELAMAAAYASGGSHGTPPAINGQYHPQHFAAGPAAYEADTYEGSYGELPSVDDLEVAAAAAAAAMDEADPSNSSPAESSSDEDAAATSPGDLQDDSSDETSSSGYESSDDVAMSRSMQLIRLELVVSDSQHVKVSIQAVAKGTAAAPAELEADVEEVDSDTSSESDTEQIADINQMREIIARMDDDNDGVDQDKEEAAALIAPVEPLEVEIGEAEVLLPAGNISSMLEGTIVVQVAENGRALTEGTVLCSEDRIPVGRIEDVFGPVMSPLYTLRWAGQGELPPTVAVGAPLFTTQKLAEYLLPEQLYTQAPTTIDDDLGDDELEFSDDEKEAEYKRKLKAKRKQRDGLEADLGAGRGAARGGMRGRARSGHMDSPGSGGGWRGGRGGRGGRGSHANTFGAMQATGQLAGMQLNSPGLPPQSVQPPAYSEGYGQAQSNPGFQAGYAEGLRLAQQQLAQQHLQAMPPPQYAPPPQHHTGYQQYWHPQQPPVPGYHSPAPAGYNPSIMPASPAMSPSAAWQHLGQQGQPQKVPPQAAQFFRGRGRGHRGGGRS